MSSALAEVTAPGDVVRLEGPAVRAYVRVIARRGERLRVSWHGVDYLAVGRRTGVDAGGSAIWTVATWEPWAIAADAPRRSRSAKGATGA